MAGGGPFAAVLAVTVEEEVLLQPQPHAQHPLADGKAVSAGGIGDHTAFRQHTGGQISVRPGRIGLEPFQTVVLPDELHRHIAQYGIGPADVLRRHVRRDGKAELRFRGRLLHRPFLLFTERQTDKDLFRHGIFLPVVQFLALLYARREKKSKPPGSGCCSAALGLFFENDQNLNRFTIRSHRRVKKLPDWVVVSVSAVLVAAATVSPVL